MYIYHAPLCNRPKSLLPLSPPSATNLSPKVRVEYNVVDRIYHALLNMANHEWGRHDTHRYIPYMRDSSSRLLTYSIPTRSLVVFMEPTCVDGDASQSYRVRKPSHN